MLALATNAFVAYILFKFKDGDSNMYFFSSKWPDLIVALFMSILSVSASYKILLVVQKELKGEKAELCQ